MKSHNFTIKTLSLALAAAMGLSAQASADIKIGVAGPHTGPNAAYGDQLWKGASQAAEDINAKGGINGEKIVLVKGDDACEPKQAIAVANRLVDSDEVKAVIGHFCSSSSVPASEVYEEAGIISISPGSTSPKLTDRGYSTVFRMCGRDDQQGLIAGNYIVDDLQATKVAIIHDKDTYGQGLAQATRDQLHARGVTEVMFEGLTRGEKDFNSLVSKVSATGAEVVYFGGLHSEAGPLVRQMREQGLKTKFISDDGIVTDELVTTAGGPKYTDGVLMTFVVDPRTLPEGQDVVKRFRDKGYEPEGYTLFSYASMQTLAAAFKATGGTDTEKAGAWIKSNPVETVMGSKEWDEKGDLKTSPYVMYSWDAAGKYKQL